MSASEIQRRRVLIAEDVKIAALTIVKALECEGFELAVAHDGEDCLARVGSFQPSLIVLDLMMPKVHGIDVLRQLRAKAETAHIGVIVCSSRRFKTRIKQAQDLGAFDVILKPFDPKELVAKARAFFDSSGPVTNDRPKSPDPSEQVSAPEIYRPTLDTSTGCLRLWGTRGSIPISGPSFARHGGNTTCLQVSCGEDVIIFDAGSGIRELGLTLMGGQARKIHLFMTHTHWDHIQGFPFFVPAYVPGFDITIYGAKGFSKDLKSIFEGQLDQAYFPVQMKDMRANLRFEYLPHEPIEINEAKVSWEFVEHPGVTVGYKIETPTTSISFMPDNEFLKGYLGSPHSLSQKHDSVNACRPIIDFLAGVDILIHEAQYTAEEYGQKVGWGHTSVPNACFLAKISGAKRWIVVHHDPLHVDDFLQTKLNLTRQVLSELECGAEVTHGFDGFILQL